MRRALWVVTKNQPIAVQKRFKMRQTRQSLADLLIIRTFFKILTGDLPAQNIFKNLRPACTRNSQRGQFMKPAR